MARILFILTYLARGLSDFHDNAPAFGTLLKP
jgi:hypothetical protein